MVGKSCTGICAGVHKKAKALRFRVPSSEVIDWQNLPEFVPMKLKKPEIYANRELLNLEPVKGY
jgi:hypothetical protein